MAEQRGHGALSPKYAEAVEHVAHLHRDQLRKGTNVPYLSHLMSVSALVLEDGGTELEAVAALLHDAVEDVADNALLAELEERYGPEVVRIVEECSDDVASADGIKRPWVERKTEYVEHVRQASDSALRIGVADKLHNLRCTVQDAREGTWPPFNACRHQQVWYFDTLVRTYLDRLPASRMARELDRVLDDLAEVLREARPAVRLPAPPPCECAVG